ncbi:MAG: hypothetical protein N3D09_04350, partial [Archaeoglobaceae archaeon]|nr:hypothetical protein [Archaeoglobaceae archaeon]
MKLDRLVEGFERVVVSFLENEYPFSFHSNEFKVVEDKVMVRKPKGISFNFVKRRACLLFHTHNEFVKEIRSLTLYGEMIQKEDLLEFHPESFYTVS